MSVYSYPESFLSDAGSYNTRRPSTATSVSQQLSGNQAGSVPIYKFSTVPALFHAALESGDDLFAASGVRQADVASIYRSLEVRRRKWRITWQEEKDGLLILTIPSSAHEHMHVKLYLFISDGLLHDYDLQGKWSSGVAATTFKGPGYNMEGDTGGKPMPERNGPEAWPTLVIESGRSQSWRSLHIKAQLWFAKSNGQVKIVLLARLCNNDRRLEVEKWVMRQRDISGPSASTRSLAANMRPQAVARLSVTEPTDPTAPAIHYTVEGDILVLEFKLLFLRDPSPPEGDIVVPVGHLQRWAKQVMDAAVRRQ